MKILLCALAILHHSQYIFAEEVRLLDLEPNDAQNIIENKDTTLKYAPKVDSNVPAVRYLGNEPHNVLEDIYLANQYHGQDGLGGYLYGYSVPDIAKTEKKKAGGDLTGAYNYIAGNGQEIKVQYWDNGNGFHQIDNVPKILPKQIEDTPEVKAAKEEHQRIWNEQAERNSHPIADPNAQVQQPYQQQPQYGQTQHLLVNQYQQQKQQYPNPGQNVFYQGGHEGQYQGQPSQSVNQYQPGGQLTGKAQGPAFGGQYSGNQPGGGQAQVQYTGSQVPSQYSGQVGQQPSSQISQFSGTGQGSQASSGKYSGSPAAGPVPVGQYSGSGQVGPYSGGQTGAQYSGQPGGQSAVSQYSGSQASSQYSAGQPGGQSISGQYSGGQPSASQQSSQYSSSHKSSGSYNEGDEGDQGDQGDWKYNPSEEEQGPPKGFFYSFDYPVGIIVQKDGGGLKDIYSSNKANFEKQLQAGGSDRSARSSTGYLVV